MKKAIAYLQAARNEFDDAANWYDARRAGLGATFTNSVHVVLERISEQPEMYADVYDGVREALVKGFPYCVYYRDEPRRILVVAVFHTARDPARWQRRV